MKRIGIIILCVLSFMVLPISVNAAENDGVLITVVIPQSEKKEETPAPAPKPQTNYLYPVNVQESVENGQREIIRTYELGAGEKPENISREPFVRDAWLYELADITKKETANSNTREHTEKISTETQTNDIASILNLLAPTMDYKSGDGYIGVLQLDVSSIKTETAGTRSRNYIVSAVREYPHLSSNDTSLIPKTITDSGRTLTLSDVNWKTQNYSAVDYDQIPDSYTAVATYTGTASRTVVTGYVTTAEYSGKISKILTGKTVYTAYYIGVPIVTPVTDIPSESTSAPETVTTTEEPLPEPVTEPTQVETEPQTVEENTEIEREKETFNPLPLLIIAVLLGAVIGGVCVFFSLKKFRKKESEVINDDKETTD